MFAIFFPVALRFLLVGSLALAACGSSATLPATEADAAADVAQDAADVAPDVSADVAPDVPFAIADHPPAPQVEKGSGSVLAQPHARVITFDGDPQRPLAEQFVADIAGSPYWTAVTAEYGVGDLVVDAPIHLAITPTPTLTDKELEDFLIAQLTDEPALWGKPDAHTIYVLVYPLGVTITEPQTGGKSCKDFGAYHSILTVGKVKVPYAAIPACPGFAGPQVDLAHVFMVSTSHELLEAATDPDGYAPAWSKVDAAHAAWGTIAGGPEIGDLCTWAEGDPYQWPDKDYTGERSWSNAAAAAGHNPCQPTNGKEPYFNAAPETPDTVKVGAYKVAGVHITTGNSVVVPVHLFSDAPTDGPWEVWATDYATWYLQSAPQLQFDWDGDNKATGQNGDVLNLTITVLKADSKKYEPYFVFSRMGETTNLWMGFVGN